jgi:hypothetical protein
MPHTIDNHNKKYEVKPAARVTYHQDWTVSIPNNEDSKAGTDFPPETLETHSVNREATNISPTTKTMAAGLRSRANRGLLVEDLL